MNATLSEVPFLFIKPMHSFMIGLHICTSGSLVLTFVLQTLTYSTLTGTTKKLAKNISFWQESQFQFLSTPIVAQRPSSHKRKEEVLRSWSRTEGTFIVSFSFSILCPFLLKMAIYWQTTSETIHTALLPVVVVGVDTPSFNRHATGHAPESDEAQLVTPRGQKIEHLLQRVWLNLQLSEQG